jgi:hypothetical protein
MSDLETFRTQTAAWLEENCPPEMRKPAKSEEDTCWVPVSRTKGLAEPLCRQGIYRS